MGFPRVFISYSHDSAAHEDRVLAFANRLRGDGIDVVLDQDEVALAIGWPLWMQKQISNARFVLLVCTPTYLRRTMKEEATGKGLGVSWEAHIIYQELYEAGAVNTRFIPVLLDNTEVHCIPTPFRSL